MKFKYMMLVCLAMLILTVSCVSAAEDANQTTLTQNEDSQALSESWNWTMDVDDEIEIIPAQDQEINIKNSPFAYSDNNYNYSLSVDDNELKVKVLNDRVMFDASNLTYGSHKYELKFLGNNFYKPTSKIGVLNVTNIHIDIKDKIILPLDDDFNSFVEVYLQNNQTGLLTVYMDDVLKQSKNFTANDDKSYFYYEFLGYGRLKIGNFTVRVVFNDTMNVIEKTKKVKVDYVLSCGYDFRYGDTRLYINAPEFLKNVPQVKVNGVNYKTLVDYDITDFKLYYIDLDSVLDIGDYPIEISYAGDEYYPAKTVNETLKVRSKIIDNYYPPRGSIKLPKNANGALAIEIYDYSGKMVKTVSEKVINGQATIRFSQSGVYGKYAYVIVKYVGSDYDVEDVIMKGVSIPPKFDVPQSMVVGEKKSVSLNLPGKQGKIFVTASGAKYKKYTASLVNGKASISLADLPAGEYRLSITFKESTGNGTENYLDSYDLTILDHINFINANDIYYGSANVKLQCYGENGKVLANKYLTVKVNGKTLKKIKTNKKGEATIKLSSKYTPKKYKITVTYVKYKTTKTIKVKQVLSFDKIKVKKSAKKLIFNVNLKKGDKPIKSKKITVKFNGKTYKAKTNKKGIAKVTVKKSVLKKLKIGKKVTIKATYLKTSITKKVKVQK